jgi:hypothetical protein
MYEAYKPFRNYMRRFALEPALVHLWRLSQHLEHDGPLPGEMGPPPERWAQGRKLGGHLFAWDLDILAREIVLNAQPAGAVLDRWNDLAPAINHLRCLDNVATQAFFADGGDVMREMHRLAHRQFPWQMPPNRNSLLRYMRIFGREGVEPIVLQQTGLTVLELNRLTFATCGHFLRRPGLSTQQSYAVLGLDAETSRRYFDRLSSDVPTLRAAVQKEQRYDGAWLYAWNPLRARPLIRFDPAHPDRVLCPIPSLLMRRVSEGLYYDLIEVPAFANAFGRSFQTYVGEILSLSCPAPRFELFEEREYWVGKNRKDGLDWILQDADATLFIECKTSRLRIDAKVSSDTEALCEALDRLAKAVAQNYKNIEDALAGLTHWAPSQKTPYPLVVTLEDWWVFNPTIYGLLDEGVRRHLAEAGLDPALPDKMPYTIASAAELEIAAGIIAQVGIDRFMREKTTNEHRQWAVSPFAANVFEGVGLAGQHQFFQAEWSRLTPEQG